MKTNKSLLVKFLTVLCALCLSLSVAFGLVACGEEEVKSVVGAEINSENKLVLIYSDGSKSEGMDIVGKDGVDGEDGKDLTACDHKNSVISDYKMPINSIDPEAKFADICTIQQAVCLDCDYLYVVAHGHDFKDVDAVAATCYAEGHEAGKECKDCGYFTGGKETEKVPHTEKTYFIAYEDEKMSPCTHGGFLVTVCEVCRAQGINEILNKSVVGGLGHSSTAWRFAQELDKPTLNREGKLTASVCDDCGMPGVEKIIPALNETDYVKTTKVAKVKCTDKEIYNYAYKLGEQTFNFEVESEAGKHVIGYDEDGNAIYHDREIYAYDEDLFSLIEVEGIANATCKVPTNANAFFICQEEGCNTNVGVKVVTDHKTVTEVLGNEPAVATPSGCETKGYYVSYTCPDCATVIGDTQEEKDAYLAFDLNGKGHDYEYKITKTYEGTANVDLLGICKNGCGVDDTSKINVTATYEKKDATCKDTGFEKWTITEIDGVALDEALEVTNTIEKLNHKLDGEFMDLDADAPYSWNEWKDRGMFDLEIDGAITHTCSEGGFIVGFVCSECGTNVGTTAQVDHLIPVVDGEEVYQTTKGVCSSNPDDIVNIEKYYICARTECGKKQVVETIVVTHKYEYTYEVTNDNGTPNDKSDDEITITGTCVNAELHANDTGATVVYVKKLSELSSSVTKVATCKEKGEITYSWTEDGANISIPVETPKALHTYVINGEKVEINNNMPVTLAPGMSLLDETVPACGSTPTEVNAFFICANEDCGAKVGIKAVTAHKEPENKEDYIEYTDAKCGVAGSKKFYCDGCESEVTLPIDALEHVKAYDYDTLVKPDADTMGSINVVCTREGCGANIYTVDIPKLTDASNATGSTYTYEIKNEASCQGFGVITYTYKDVTYGEVVFDVVTPAVDHDVNDVPEYTWEYNGKIYTGKVCKLGEDKHIVVISVVDKQPTP